MTREHPHQADSNDDGASNASNASIASDAQVSGQLGPQLARGALGGSLMGLANLVPGISGGTMLLAAGVYPSFVNAVADVSALRFRMRSILMLIGIVVPALAVIVLLAGPVSAAVVHQRWIMYSLFIGLTLGGVPVIWKMMRPAGERAFAMTAIGVALMIILSLAEPGGGAASTATEGHPYLLYVLAGIAAASAMVLPGVSGSYLLLLLGQYVAILTSVELLKDGVRAGDTSQIAEAMHIVAPVGIGVIIGVVGVSNMIRVLLRRHEKATLGFLLGLLLGAVVGFWPFRSGVAPSAGELFRGDRVAVGAQGELIMAATGRVIEAADYPPVAFAPSLSQIAGCLGLILVGFAVSIAIAHVGSSSNDGNNDGAGGRSLDDSKDKPKLRIAR